MRPGSPGRLKGPVLLIDTTREWHTTCRPVQRYVAISRWPSSRWPRHIARAPPGAKPLEPPRHIVLSATMPPISDGARVKSG
jgi:hypothetical protein